MCEDRELLELAAKANWAGELEDMSIRWGELDNCILYIHGDNQDHNGIDQEYRWDPLDDDGDALRLAVDLRLTVLEASVRKPDGDVVNVWPGEAADRYAATRRAIVRAAAAIGKTQP